MVMDTIYRMVEVDSILSADPAAPSSAGSK
jgi:hypothetical protein